jgi:hypothetical protein
MGKSTINGNFSIAMLNYQRVYEFICVVNHLPFLGTYPSSNKKGRIAWTHPEIYDYKKECLKMGSP